MFGIRFSETLSGSVRSPSGADERRFSFTVTAQGRRLWHVALGAPLTLQGHVTLGGVVDRAPAHGTLVVDAFRSRRVHYELLWVDPQGRPQRFHGHQDLRLGALFTSLTVLRGTVYALGQPFGEATLRLDPNDLPQLLLGVRPTLAL